MMHAHCVGSYRYVQNNNSGQLIEKNIFLIILVLNFQLKSNQLIHLLKCVDSSCHLLFCLKTNDIHKNWPSKSALRQNSFTTCCKLQLLRWPYASMLFLAHLFYACLVVSSNSWQLWLNRQLVYVRCSRSDSIFFLLKLSSSMWIQS